MVMKKFFNLNYSDYDKNSSKYRIFSFKSFIFVVFKMSRMRNFPVILLDYSLHISEKNV